MFNPSFERVNNSMNRLVTVALLAASGLILAVGVPRWANLLIIAIFLATFCWIIQRGDDKAAHRNDK